jgi:hypothetical protein
LTFLLLLLADAFAQMVMELVVAQEFIATLWTFSMRAVDVGALLLSAWLECRLYRRRFRVKDWPYSQAANQTTVCDFVLLPLEVGLLSLLVMFCRELRCERE